MTGHRLLSIALLLAALAAAGCSSSTTSSAPSPGPTASAGVVVPITTPQAAMAAVVATEPRFADVAHKAPDAIGQAAWWDATPASGVGAFIVTVRVGWGDCQAGCIDEHAWTYAVRPDGTVVVLGETGPEVPSSAWPSPSTPAITGIVGTALAGPSCPVVQDPPDPACAPRPVVGARVLVHGADGSEVASVRTDDAGRFAIELPPGRYIVEAQPVDGLMGTPAQQTVDVTDGPTTIELEYDTGIR